MWRTFPRLPRLGPLDASYTRRVVPTSRRVAEKVRIAEGGLDDREVELIKLLVCINDGIDVGTPMLFTKMDLHGRESTIASSFCFPATARATQLNNHFDRTCCRNVRLT